MTITILYFSYFRQLTNKDEEEFILQWKTPKQVYDFINEYYQFNYYRLQCQVAINDELCSWNTLLKEGDKVAFLTPYSGG